MSDITVGSEWIDAGGTDLIVTDITEHHIEFIYRSKFGRSLNEMEVDLFKSLFKPVEREKEDDSADMVNNPPHYNDESGVPCCDVTDFMMFNGGNCFKYLYRCGSKFDDIEDLKKAAWYAERAKQKGEFHSDGNWAYLIREIARYRSNDAIHTAMIALRWCRWSDVVVAIKAEIARLESE